MDLVVRVPPIVFAADGLDALQGWSTAALANPQGYLRAGSAVYPVRLERVTEPAELDVAWSARLGKIGADPGTLRPDHWWSFRLTARDQSAGQ